MSFVCVLRWRIQRICCVRIDSDKERVGRRRSPQGIVQCKKWRCSKLAWERFWEADLHTLLQGSSTGVDLGESAVEDLEEEVATQKRKD